MGRPKLNKVHLHIKMSLPALRYLDHQTKRRKMTRSDYLEMLVMVGKVEIKNQC